MAEEAKMVVLQYNKESPHKIGANRGGGESAPTPSIILRPGLNKVPAAAWEVAKQLPLVKHYLTAKEVPVVRDGKRVLVPMIEEVDAEAEKKKKADADAEAKAKAEADKKKAEAEAAEAKKKEEEAKKKGGQGQGGGSGSGR